MKSIVIRLACFFIFTFFAFESQSQKKSNSEKKKETPSPEKLIGIVGNEPETQVVTREGEVRQKPEIQFDTTHAPNDSFTADIIKLLHATGALKRSLSTSYVGNPETRNRSEKDSIKREFNRRLYYEYEFGSVPRHMTNFLVNQYREIFTHEEVKQLIALHETELGKKIYKFLPKLEREGYSHGDRVVEYYAEKVMYDLLLEAQKNQNK